jgi:hypothetical protein
MNSDTQAFSYKNASRMGSAIAESFQLKTLVVLTTSYLSNKVWGDTFDVFYLDREVSNFKIDN